MTARCLIAERDREKPFVCANETKKFASVCRYRSEFCKPQVTTKGLNHRFPWHTHQAVVAIDHRCHRFVFGQREDFVRREKYLLSTHSYSAVCRKRDRLSIHHRNFSSHSLPCLIHRA